MTVRRCALLGFLVACLTVACAAAGGFAAAGEGRPPPPLSAERFAALHARVKPRADEARWATVPWMAATDIWAARRAAAERDKPVLLWYMAGEPLGTC